MCFLLQIINVEDSLPPHFCHFSVKLQWHRQLKLNLSSFIGLVFQLYNTLWMQYSFRDYMDRLVDEAESLGGAVHSASNNRTETIPDQQLSILNSITANELTGKSREKKYLGWNYTNNYFICICVHLFSSTDKQCSHSLPHFRCELPG